MMGKGDDCVKRFDALPGLNCSWFQLSGFFVFVFLLMVWFSSGEIHRHSC